MVKMWWFCSLLFLLWTLLTVASQESVEFITLHDTTSEALRGLSHHPNDPVAISLQNEVMVNISRSVVAAESWVRTHVLAQYPSTNVTTIVVGHSVLCDKEKDERFGLILPSMKNIFYSLTRWGLEKEIKVSASFGSSCLDLNSGVYRGDLSETFVKPLLRFLQETNSPYLVNTNSENLEFSVYAHSNAMEKIEFLWRGGISVVVDRPIGGKSRSRKLSFLDSDVVYPYPARPTPLGPTQEPTGSSTPAYAANTPLPPLVGEVSPPPFTLPFPFAPQSPPEAAHPGSPHYGPHLPPCAPPPSDGYDVGAPPPYDGGEVAKPPSGRGRGHGGLWCVAKPSVPTETLQEALDFACGEGGADCEEIQPSGNCYFPDSIVAHASYAFNSYWQKTKTIGGVCGFGGTAMLINSDPSYRHCRFDLA